MCHVVCVSLCKHAASSCLEVDDGNCLSSSHLYLSNSLLLSFCIHSNQTWRNVRSISIVSLTELMRTNSSLIRNFQHLKKPMCAAGFVLTRCHRKSDVQLPHTTPRRLRMEASEWSNSLPEDTTFLRNSCRILIIREDLL